ncbi:unnamed protein product [Blepharisma stoltei]|uniref:E3 ubiquitin-protein ligase CHFR n=1 Tax=Blepharisma stoltei TaxID=1481888 RepID=A0AAU9K116_9CILI|nr:unnamed protein product [Blepharisma stoltei]
MENHTENNSSQNKSGKIVAILVSNNEKTAENYEIKEDEKQIIIGRSPNSTIKLNDSKCSKIHCMITIIDSKDEIEFLVEDFSSNSTFINNNTIGKGKISTAQFGDILTILREKQVGPDKKIEFVFQKPTEKRPHENDENFSNKSKKTSTSLEEQFKCQICMGIMYQPVTLFPCLHNFCGGCLSGWTTQSFKCPNCRVKSEEVRKNNFLTELIATYLKENPDARRDEEELKDLKSRNKFNRDTVKLGVDIKLANENDIEDGEEFMMFNPGDYVIDEESDDDWDIKEKEVKSPQRLPNPYEIKRGIGPNRRRPAQVNRNNYEKTDCLQCENLIDGFQCPRNQNHIQCKNCHRYMPQRAGTNQDCAICGTHYCNKYWKNGLGCIDGLNEIINNVRFFNKIPKESMKENPIEQTILADYINNYQIKFVDIANEMIQAMEIERWNMKLDGKNTILNRNSLVCKKCSKLVWCELIYRFREKIPKDRLPVSILQKKNCWYGRECTTQTHNIEHAQKLNHICAQTRDN